MKSREIRTKFFDFFTKRGHSIVPSSSLIPAQDPTLLFANAGMNQFKDVFLGKETRSYKRAVSIQKCIRAGGKHNDLDNVGFTARHLTFFEMMGNFSFGDYFKKDAIRYAWDFLTQEMHLPAEKLYASVYLKDDEAYDIWHKEIGLPKERIVRLGEADNFWQMGDVGPCGPCTEIYLDRSEKYGCKQQTCAPGCSCDRFIEIWNNVFMQFDRQKDEAGNYIDKPLKQTGVDTGMGLERLCMVVQHKDSVFDSDLFVGIIDRTEQLTGLKYAVASDDIKAAFRVLADHVRSASFAIADGCTPSNEGRGYVLRKIIRRAALFAQKLSTKNIFPEIVPALVYDMGVIYPELAAQQPLITALLTSEIEKFAQNLISGQAVLAKYMQESQATKKISGAQAFKLYDTYGFPLELTQLIAQEKGYTIDTAGFEQEMERQRAQSGKKETAAVAVEVLPTEFTGYQETENTTRITALMCESSLVEEVPAGKKCFIITEKSPFYVECGGQISDEGWLVIDNAKISIGTLKKIDHAIAAEITAPARLQVGDIVALVVDKEKRANTMKNHTATHLLQAALMQVLGKQVRQSGSLVAPDYLRFDFTYHENLTSQNIKKIEDIVNQKIMENISTKITQTTYKDALSRGVIAFFGEKYNPENVRVVEIPGFSAELCGGTHVRATGDIGCFKITEVSSLSAGNRRIVAVTGPKAVELFQESFGALKYLASEFKVKLPDVADAVQKLREQCKESQQQLKSAKQKLITLQVPQLVQGVEEVGKVPFGFIKIADADAADLRDIATSLVQAKPAFYFAYIPSKERAHFVITVPASVATVDSKVLSSWLKEQGLVGGGSSTFMQGSGVIDETFKGRIKQWVEQNVA